MNPVLVEIEKILGYYSEDNNVEDIKKAKELFIKLTGHVDEESGDYESWLNSFNDWFIFNYDLSGGKTPLQAFWEKHKSRDEVKSALENANYSLFYFHKINFRKQVVIKDVLHDKKLILAKEHSHLALVEDDIFVGRMVEYDGGQYILNGLCTLPREVFSVLKKEAKKIQKLNNENEEINFLLHLERLKTRSLHYGHVQADKMFTF